jgi:hypothetical protein
MPLKGQFGPVGPRPHLWKSGPDVETHAQYEAWNVARTQARFRREAWDMSWEDWQTFWEGSWHLRGRTSTSSMMTRRDCRQAWSLDNVQLITRAEFGVWQQELRRQRLAGAQDQP